MYVFFSLGQRDSYDFKMCLSNDIKTPLEAPLPFLMIHIAFNYIDINYYILKRFHGFKTYLLD